MSKGHVLGVVGGQYGSEGKGVVVAHLADRYGVHIRVGAPNAGHSFKHLGSTWKMQSVPVGWKNPAALLVIGRGALVNPRILKNEIEVISEVDPTLASRLIVDGGAGVLDDKFFHEEGGIDGEIHRRIGSTGEGVGAARVARINRDPTSFRLFRDAAPEFGLERLVVEDTPALLLGMLNKGQNLLIEGSQGSGLSLVHGPWPYVTSADSNICQMAADIGIAPRWITRVLLVVRTHPIRVAGNSGPLRDELTWDQISERLGRTVEERTTVTRKIRRIGSWDDELVQQAIVLNGPSSIALTFADYLSPPDEGKTQYSELSELTKRFVDYLERRFDTGVSLIGTGGDNWQVVETGKSL